jgi:hypothetical protein
MQPYKKDKKCEKKLKKPIDFKVPLSSMMMGHKAIKVERQNAHGKSLEGA